MYQQPHNICCCELQDHHTILQVQQDYLQQRGQTGNLREPPRADNRQGHMGACAGATQAAQTP